MINFFLGFVIFVFSFIIFPFPKLTQAQSPPVSQGWFCAKTTHCDREGYQEGTCTLRISHRVRLETDPENRPNPNINETYLVECLSGVIDNTPQFRCTTGSSSLDQQAFGVDHYSWLKTNWGYSLEKDERYGIFKVENNRAEKIGAKEYKTGPSGGLIIKETNEPVSLFEWQSYVPQGRGHKFYFLQKFPSSPAVELGQGGQQQATSFDWVNADKDCVVISWDPAGRVFDALSLEPVPQASVFLTKKNEKGEFVNASQFELGIINPQLTTAQGGFSFYVSDGDYKLTIKNLDSLGYQRIAANLAEINSKYREIYYYLDSGRKKTFIYPSETGEIIQQRGKIQYRDLPLVAADGQGKSYPLKVINVFYSVKGSSGQAVFEGSVSHPFTQVIIYGVNNKKREKIIYQGITDNFGDYKIVFDQSLNGEVYDSFEVDFVKTNLSNISKKNVVEKIITWFLNKITILAQTSLANKVSLRLDPIPTYLEGVAKDQSGKVLANSQVKIYIKGMKVPYTVVNTDSQGYFKVPSTRLPFFSYEIEYQDPSGKITTVSTSKFIADNRNLISSKNIKVYSLRDSQGKAIKITPKEDSFSGASGKNLIQGPDKTRRSQVSPTKTQESSRFTASNGVVLMVAIIFFLLIIIGVIVYFYFRQRRSSSLGGEI